MPLAYPFRVLVPRRAAPEAAVLAAVALLILAGAAGLVPASVVIALAGGAGATLAGVRLTRLASRRRTAVTHSDLSSAEPSPLALGVLLDAAVVAAGLTAATLPLVDTGQRAAALAGALIVAAVSAAGLLRLPGRPSPWAVVRLRGPLSATAPAVGLALAGWLLLPGDVVSAPVRLVGALALGGLGMAALNAFTGRGRRSGAGVCRGGVLLILLALALLTVLPPVEAGRGALVAVPPLVLGMLLTAFGADAAVAVGDVQSTLGPAALTWPRVVLPAAVLLLVVGLHAAAGRTPDRTSVLLALAAVPPLVLRELLGGADAATGERRAAHRRRTGRALRQLRWPGAPDDRAEPPADASESGPDAPWPSGGGTSTGGGATWASGGDAGTSTSTPAWPSGDAGTSAGCFAWPDDGDAGTSTGGVAWPDCGVAWSPSGRGSVSGGDGPADRAALLDALASIGDVPAPAGALLLVDLHGADGLGPVAREDILAEAVLRVRAVVAPGDLVTGCTGTGFAVVTAAGPVLAYALGTRLLAALTPPYRWGGSVLRVQTSIGLAEVGGAGPADVLRQAELARRRAVQLGRDRVEWYDAFLEEQLVRRLDLERELPGAVARGELDLVYQPVVDLTDRQPVGAEALLRWRSPVLGTVLPAELLPVAEDLDLVGELEWWVVDRACRQLADWSAGNRELWMAVNVTTRELTTPDFVQRVAAVLAAYGVSPERLVVEVAEPRIGGDLSTVVARLAGLRSLGVRTALDDFRAEHASLAHLRRLPIDLLKVGPGLVGAQSAGQPPLIDVVVNVGERLGVEIVAEELESPIQVEGAHRAGCHYGQGFALARPATAERVEAYFEEFPSASR
ncbi:GGDEF domain-containing phosphodiesterase [Micromonospora profundi]|uniref:putative bifunctional diguanylate cyclase/phosphodiesterase n=1 Tax=Micromonospora profundi TaxID=1420889 RepID=UPI002FF0E502